MKRAIVSACMVVLATGSFAAEDSEILVTAGRSIRSSDDVPANVSVIGKDEIRSSRNESIADVLADAEGIVVQGISDNPAMSEVSMRGFAENGHGRVLVLVDGRRLNWPSMSNINWLEVPLSSVERIEIVRGGASVLYGDHAVAGVINIITDQSIPEKPVEVKVTAGENGLLNAALAYGAKHGDADVGINLSRYEEDGYRDRSAFESSSFGARVGMDVGDSATVNVTALVQSDEYEIPGWLSKAQMDEDPSQSLNPDDSAEQDYWNLQANTVFEPSEDASMDLVVSFSRKDVKSDMTSWFSYADTVLDSVAVMPKCAYGAKPGDEGNRITIGVDFYDDELDVDRYADKARTSKSISATVEKQSVGGYVYDEIALQDGLVLSAGVRIEQNRVSAVVDAGGATTVDDNKTHDAVAYEASVLKKLGSGSKVYIKAGTSYRYPFLDEQVSYYGFGTDEFYRDIDQEEGWSVEAGGDYRLNDQVSVGLNVFLMNMEDEIAYNAVTMSNENQDKTKRIGAECNVEYEPADGVMIAANYSVIDAQFADGVNDGKDIPLVPQHKGSLIVEGELPGSITARAVVTHMSERWLGGDYGNTGEKLDAYTTVDFFLTCVPSEGLEVFAGVENLTDEDYAGVAYQGFMEDGYYPAAGATFKGGAAYRF